MKLTIFFQTLLKISNVEWRSSTGPLVSPKFAREHTNFRHPEGMLGDVTPHSSLELGKRTAYHCKHMTVQITNQDNMKRRFGIIKGTHQSSKEKL